MSQHVKESGAPPPDGMEQVGIFHGDPVFRDTVDPSHYVTGYPVRRSQDELRIEPEETWQEVLDKVVRGSADIIFYYVNDKEEVFVSFHDRGNNEPCPDFWIVGGKQIKDASPAQSAAETAEAETGVAVNPAQIWKVGSWSLSWPSPTENGVHDLTTVFACRLESPFAIDSGNQHFSGQKWVPVEGIEDKHGLHPAARDMAQKVEAGHRVLAEPEEIRRLYEIPGIRRGVERYALADGLRQYKRLHEIYGFTPDEAERLLTADMRFGQFEDIVPAITWAQHAVRTLGSRAIAMEYVSGALKDAEASDDWNALGTWNLRKLSTGLYVNREPFDSAIGVGRILRPALVAMEIDEEQGGALLGQELPVSAPRIIPNPPLRPK